jgi:transposase
MPKFKELMRLKFEAKLPHRAIARALGVGPGTVSRYAHLMEAAGLSWPLPPGFGDDELERRLFPARAPGSGLTKTLPEFAQMHQALKGKGVTLTLLWEEYREAVGVDHAYRYSQYCQRYRQWKRRLKRSMRQTHRAGEKLFVDYAGSTVEVVDPTTGEVREANIFVAVLGASSYTYAEATWTQSLPDWCGSHARAFEFFQGCPMLVIPDNLRSAVSKACRYDPELNPTYAQLAAYFSVAVLPARPRRAKDKAKVEVAVQVVQRWVLARLRHHTFFSLAELNGAIRELLEDLNNRPFKRLPGSRRVAFEQLDRPALRPLPATPYRYTEVKQATVYVDYHVEVDGHYYSVPHRLVGEAVQTHASATLVSVLHRGRPVASHVRSRHTGGFTTVPEHMPRSHREHAQWSPGRFMNWAGDIGPSTRSVVRNLLERRPHPEHGYRSCLGLLNLHKRYGAERLEAACRRAVAIGSPTRKSVLSILEQGLDALTLESADAPEQTTLALTPEHENVRGAGYYH